MRQMDLMDGIDARISHFDLRFKSGVTAAALQDASRYRTA